MNKSLRDNVKDWDRQPWAYKQGWLSYEKDKTRFNNPHLSDSSKSFLFMLGWLQAMRSDHIEKYDGFINLYTYYDTSVLQSIDNNDIFIYQWGRGD